MNEKEMDHYKHVHLVCTIKNCVILICFTILAIFFNNVWIVLMAALFWGNIDIEEDEHGETNRNDNQK